MGRGKRRCKFWSNELEMLLVNSFSSLERRDGDNNGESVGMKIVNSSVLLCECL